MPAQEQIADQGKPATHGPCSWCGETTSLTLAIRPGSGKGAKALKVPFQVWVCSQHMRTLELRGDA